MRQMTVTRIASVGLALSCFLGLSACSSGSTDGGAAGEENFAGEPFSGETGSISLRVMEDPLKVASTTGFIAEVRDASNSPVPHIRVTCDSEQGVAIIEPSSGSEITDTWGAVSGRIGCAAPGSYQFACRLPVGANKRAFVTVHCTGAIPTGFEGFPGSGGGTLGGGSGDPTDAGPGGENVARGVRVTAVGFVDDGSTSGALIDISRNLCGEDDPATIEDERTHEPFFNTILVVDVTNNTNSTVTFNSYDYVATDANGAVIASSSNVSLTGAFEVAPNGGSAQIQSLFGNIAGGGDIKVFVNTDVPMTNTFVTVNVTLNGVTDDGTQFSVSRRTGVNMAPFDRCE